MREVKFRVWDKTEKIVWYEFNIGIGGQSETKQFILMQFTGLKDKTGKEIYEGDILDNAPQMIKVCWDSIGGKWFGHYLDKKITSSFWMGNEFKNYKIIGNIY